MRKCYNYLAGYNLDLQSQVNCLCKIISKNKNVLEVVKRTRLLNLKHYYIGAGCLAQTVWNYLSGYPLSRGISDIDLVYYDQDISYEKENQVINEANKLFSDIPLQIDIKNQARVHLWYQEHFGQEITPYSSVEAAINTWPTTTTALGIKLNQDNSWVVYAPYGLNDLFAMIVKANKIQITKEIYEKKVSRWIMYWPGLKVIPW